MTWPAPIPENQSSVDDTWACSDYATTHAIESQIQMITSRQVDLSARFLAIMSGTIPGQGNYLSKVFQTIETYGLLEAADCPQPPEPWTNAEYYGFDITPELKAKALKFLDEWEITYTLSQPGSVMLPKLKIAPLVAFVPQGSPIHFVEVLDANTRFDSYPPYVRPLGSVQNFSQFIIKPKNMSNAVFAHKPGTSEYGFFLPKTSEEALKDMALNLGREDILVNGKVDFSKAQEGI